MYGVIAICVVLILFFKKRTKKIRGIKFRMVAPEHFLKQTWKIN